MQEGIIEDSPENREYFWWDYKHYDTLPPRMLKTECLWVAMERMPVPVRFEGMAMAHERLSQLQRRILAWLVAEDQQTRGTMAAIHEELVRMLVALGFDKGNVSTSLKGLAAKGLVTVARTPGGRAEAVDLTC